MDRKAEWQLPEKGWEEMLYRMALQGNTEERLLSVTLDTLSLLRALP